VIHPSDRRSVADVAQAREDVAESSFSRLVTALAKDNMAARAVTRASERSSQMARTYAQPQQSGGNGPTQPQAGQQKSAQQQSGQDQAGQQQQGQPSGAVVQQAGQPIFRDWASI
jgi:hypothetical protein